ncbi:ATP-binding cassette domain-containing protein [Thaumasiovibrio subtropicus]|uniref:ATP-binding cassette domain-containing protein n=1 Tax=Thaumasiovibrio subtropicus TaxID=1891207 RepID=UPI000B3536C0|nr:ATP-binding cassette domain-containing protein [Thaumasiovibrio subtropicus]
MNVINIENLTFRWPGQQKDLLRIPQFSLTQGEKVFLKGPSGSGKSSLLSLLSGITDANSGEIMLLDTPMSSLKPAQKDRFRADNLGYIFQMFNLLPYLSVIDNVLLPCRFSSQRKQNISGSLEAEAKRLLLALHLPEDTLDKPVTQLSIGQQQRVAAARALIGQPPLLIADEPTSALDHDNRTAFIELLMKECDNAGTSLLFVSHDHTLEALFDRSIDLLTLNEAYQEVS